MKSSSKCFGDAVGLLQSSYDNAVELEKKLQAQLKQQESDVLDLEASPCNTTC